MHPGFRRIQPQRQPPIVRRIPDKPTSQLRPAAMVPGIKPPVLSAAADELPYMMRSYHVETGIL